ncbi:MAG: ATP synthase F1 subunit epsilon [Microthrixaceae bacterium]
MGLVVELVSPERIAFSGNANMVICRTTTGDLAFLAGHVPFIGVLDAHPVRIVLENGSEQVVAVHHGFVEVSPTEGETTRVTVLSDLAELASDIDVARAEAARDRAEAILASDENNVEARAALLRAQVRISAANAAA